MTNFEKIQSLKPMELASFLSGKVRLEDVVERRLCKQCLEKHGYCRWEDPNEEQCMYDDESLIYDFLMEECDEETHS